MVIRLKTRGRQQHHELLQTAGKRGLHTLLQEVFLSC